MIKTPKNSRIPCRHTFGLDGVFVVLPKFELELVLLLYQNYLRMLSWILVLFFRLLNIILEY